MDNLTQEEREMFAKANGKAKGFKPSSNQSNQQSEGEVESFLQKLADIDPAKRNGDAALAQVQREMAAVSDSETEGRIQANRKAEAYLKGMADQDAINQIEIADRVAELQANRQELIDFAHSTTGSAGEVENSTLKNAGKLDLAFLKGQLSAAKNHTKN